MHEKARPQGVGPVAATHTEYGNITAGIRELATQCAWGCPGELLGIVTVTQLQIVKKGS